jgi:hypothetical protein
MAWRGELSDISIDFITYHGRSMTIEGRSSMGASRLLLIRKTGNLSKIYQPEQNTNHSMSGDGFIFNIDTPSDRTKIRFYDSRATDEPISIFTGPFTGLAYQTVSYKVFGSVIFRKQKKSIVVTPHTKYKVLGLELLFLMRILFDWRLRAARKAIGQTERDDSLNIKRRLLQILKPVLIIIEAIAMIPRTFILRVGYFVARCFKRRPIWIISDRLMAAGDNGEAFFRYSMKQQDDIDIYFVLSKRSSDYLRLIKIGPVLNPRSLAYKLKFLMADKIISSHADTWVTNPFLRQVTHFANLFNFDFIFLQHGVTRHDMTDWLGRYEKNIQLFITAGRKEYESILDLPYYYDKKQILLSGFPRYDHLAILLRHSLNGQM